MPNRLLSSRLAAHTGTRQVEASDRADRAAASVDRAISIIWQRILALLASNPSYLTAQHQMHAILADLYPLTSRSIEDSLLKIGRWGYRTAQANLMRTLPTAYLRAASPAPVEILRGIKRQRVKLVPQFAGRLQEAYTPPGAVQLGYGTDGAFTFSDRLTPLRPPTVGTLTDAQQRALFEQFLFPPLTPLQILSLMNHPEQGLPWYQQLANSTRLATPAQLASTMLNGISAGLTQQQIARELMPVVNNVRVSARRIARTEGLRVAHAVQMQAHAQVDDLIAGYQIHAVLDLVTRPAHRHRNGKVWLKTDPVPMQQKLEMEGPTLPDGFN